MKGLRLGLSLTGAAGIVELVSNGTFTTDTTGWTARDSGVLSVVAGRLRLTNGANSWGGAYQAITTVIGATYRVSRKTFDGTSAPDFRISNATDGTSPLVIDNTQDPTGTTSDFVATATTTYVVLFNNSSPINLYSEYDDISVYAI